MGGLFSRPREEPQRSLNAGATTGSQIMEDDVSPPRPSRFRGQHYGPSPQAQMDDLTIELKAVNWHQLGVQLQVPFDRLDKIEEDYRSSERRLSEVLRYWQQNEYNPTWDKICDALERIGGFRRLVRELRMKYCSLRTCHLQGKLVLYPLYRALSQGGAK